MRAGAALDDTMASPNEDYLANHFSKAKAYDANIAGSPFDAYMAAWERRLLPELIRRFHPSGLQRYLDFACGTGRITEQIAPLAAQSTAVDISPAMIEQVRAKCPTTRLFLGDLTQDPMDLGAFDLATAFRFFGTARDELREGAMAAIARHLAPGGHLIVNSHRNPRALHAAFGAASDNAPKHFDLTLPKLRALLERHGMTIVALRPIGAWMVRPLLMRTTAPESFRAVIGEALFGAAMFAPIAPDTIVVARKG